MKKIFLTLLIIVIGLISAFFLNSDFKNLIINIGASTSKKEVLHQLGKDIPPLVYITNDIPAFEKKDKIIYNNYRLIITNTNTKGTFYKIKINNKKFTLSIQDNIYVASKETKKIPFQISIQINDIMDLKNIEVLEINIIDKNNPTLKRKEHVGFIVKNI